MQPKSFTSVADYLAFEAASETKHEYWDGEVVAMAGASWKHAVIVTRIAAEISRRAKGRCQAASSGVRVNVDADKYVYPDVVVVCGEPEFTGDRPESVTYPTVLVEVLSESTAEVDRLRKLAAYTHPPSLREYWMVEQDTPHTTRYVLIEGRWVLHLEGDADTVIRSEHLGIELVLAAVHA